MASPDASGGKKQVFHTSPLPKNQPKRPIDGNRQVCYTGRHACPAAEDAWMIARPTTGGTTQKRTRTAAIQLASEVTGRVTRTWLDLSRQEEATGNRQVREQAGLPVEVATNTRENPGRLARLAQRSGETPW